MNRRRRRRQVDLSYATLGRSSNNPNWFLNIVVRGFRIVYLYGEDATYNGMLSRTPVMTDRLGFQRNDERKVIEINEPSTR